MNRGSVSEIVGVVVDVDFAEGEPETADVVVSAMGGLHEAQTPEFKGKNKFLYKIRNFQKHFFEKKIKNKISKIIFFIKCF